MGDPRRLRKKYETPPHPWQEDRIKYENELIEKFGLKNKREIWKAQTTLRKYRAQARFLLPRANSVKHQKDVKQLLEHLVRMNILKPGSSLSDILSLTVEDVLSRRLQTLVYLKGLASTPKQARQFIVHGHIAIAGRKVTVPSYMVKVEEEGEIGYAPDSPLNDETHPARPPADMIKRRVGIEMGSTTQSE